jgi:SAM-dependent methyltransferase
MDKIEKLRYLIFHYGVINFLKGILKIPYYKFLIKRYNADRWQTFPAELRIYAMALVKLINTLAKTNKWTHVVEIGCGIGDILRKIEVEDKQGYDISDTAILVAKLLDKNQRIKYKTGSFNCVKNQKIDCLISVNFIHMLPPTTLRTFYDNILVENDIQFLIVDTVGKNYKYQHNFDDILPATYKKEIVLGPFQGERYLLLYKRTTNI